MDFKKLAMFIMILGALTLGFGGIKWVINQPKTFNKAESKKSVFGGRDDLGNALNVMSINFQRERERKNSVKVIIAGGIILFIGGAISASSKKKILA